MEATSRSIDALFNSRMRYVVPMFQRLYVWEETPQWSTLWEDVIEKAALQLERKKANAHYLGAVIVEGVQPSSPQEVMRFLVIDGQQRLTTIQLLLCAFRDFVRSQDWKMLDRTSSRYLENSDVDVMEKPEEERYKLWPSTLNRQTFADVLSAGSRSAVEQKHPLIRLRRKRRYEPRSPLVNAYIYFATQIPAWVSNTAKEVGRSEEECAFALLQAIQQDFCVVHIALSDGDDSQEIFYSLNSQGRPLSQSDLLRSLIFMRAEKEKEDRDVIFKDYWGRFETPFWSTEIKRGGRTYSRLDLGLRLFLMAKTGTLIDARRVNEEYRRWTSSTPAPYTSVRDELADFSRHAECYERFEEIPAALPSTDLRRIIRDFDVSTVLPLLIFLELEAGLSKQQLEACSGVVESFLARRVFVGEETKEYNKLFVEVVGAMKGTTADKMRGTLEGKLQAGGGLTRSWPSDDRIVEAAVSRQVFSNIRTPALRIILERLELALRGKKSEGDSIPEGLQIEHVLPQNWASHWKLNGTSIPETLARVPILAKDEFAPLAESIRARNSKLHTLGNLTLVNQYLNPAASNGSFELKKIEYAHSVLRLNRYFDKLETWDEDAIQGRGKALGDLFCKVWPKPVRDL